MKKMEPPKMNSKLGKELFIERYEKFKVFPPFQPCKKKTGN